MKQTFSAGGIIVNHNNEILLINEGDGFWGFPRGRIENNEDNLSAAIREIHEETGLTDVTLVRELGSYQRHPVIHGVEDRNELKNITLFLFRTDNNLPESNSENNACKWYAPNTAIKKLSHEKDKEFITRSL